jgi:hypothetical protein
MNALAPADRERLARLRRFPHLSAKQRDTLNKIAVRLRSLGCEVW